MGLTPRDALCVVAIRLQEQAAQLNRAARALVRISDLLLADSDMLLPNKIRNTDVAQAMTIQSTLLQTATKDVTGLVRAFKEGQRDLLVGLAEPDEQKVQHSSAPSEGN